MFTIGFSGESLRNSGHSSMTPLYLYDISGWPSQKCPTYLSFRSTICADLFSCLHTLFHLIFSNPIHGTWTIVSLAIIRDGDFKLRGSCHIDCILARWPAHCLRFIRWNNSSVECHDGEGQRQAFSLDTQMGSTLWHSRQMASTLSQVLPTEQFVCGMP